MLFLLKTNLNLLFFLQKNNQRYRYFNSYCLRNPLFPFSFFENLTKNERIEYDDLVQIWENNTIKEALFLASPVLYAELHKSFNHVTITKNITKVHESFIKYLTRIATRCTPFGLFAGCSLGKITNNTAIKLNAISSFKRSTRFDMNVLVEFSQKLSENPAIKKQLLFYPNSSLYKAGNHLRYIEYTYIKNRRIHSIEAVDPTDYLTKILNFCNTGKRLSEIANILVSNEITIKEATAFVDELVENQLLVNELEPSVSGDDFLKQLIYKIATLKVPENIALNLQQFLNSLDQLDTTIGNTTETYSKISHQLKEIEIKSIIEDILFQHANKGDNALMMYFENHFHMFINRLFNSKPNIFELLIYNLLYKYFKSEKFFIKYNGK